MAGNKDFQFISYSAEGEYFFQKQTIVLIIAFELSLIAIKQLMQGQNFRNGLIEFIT